MYYGVDSEVNKDCPLLARFPFVGGFFPYEYTGTKDELLAARSTAWLGVYLSNGMPRYEIFGPDAEELLNRVCVNRDFNKLPVGGSRHALICNDKGQILANGVINKVAEHHFRTYCMIPILAYYVAALGLDVQAESYNEYFFQIDGPKSLEILEKATGCDLHDLRFARNKVVQINGTDMLVHRLGMSGSLAYEVHGDLENSDMVLAALKEAGKEFGMRLLGETNYCLNHSSGGYPNQYIHFDYPYVQDPNPAIAGLMGGIAPAMTGSAADDSDAYFANPFEIGWGNLVNFDHEFPGKEALLKLRDEERKVPVTLEWDMDDVLALSNDEFIGNAPEADEGIFSGTRVPYVEFIRVHVDKVVADGKVVGKASGRTMDYFHGTYISLAFIDRDFAADGTEVEVMWGKAAGEQRAIRAKVARFPYYNGEWRNETCDVCEMVPERPYLAK